MWQAIKDWAVAVWKKSWTQVWAWIQIGGAAALAGIHALMTTLASFSQDSTITSYMTSLNAPNWVFMSLAGAGLITYLAHGRD